MPEAEGNDVEALFDDKYYVVVTATAEISVKFQVVQTFTN